MDTLSLLSILISSFIFLLIIIEQFKYLRRKGPLSGPNFIVPFLGSTIPMIMNPTQFWFDQAKLAKSNGFSANYLVGKFIIFIRSTELSHKIFSNVRPDAFHLIGHPFGKKLFGEHNLIYMFDQAHKDLRRQIAPNFTPRALDTYLYIQQKVIVSHLEHWLSISSPENPIKLRLLCRDMNLETSQNVFTGDYLSVEERKEFNADYNYFNTGLMAIPFDFPGFAFRNARLAVDRLIQALSGCVARSRERVSAGKEPGCLVDFWVQDKLDSDDLEVGGHLFDFLFAAQDASTSSLLWAVTLLESHQEVLERVREEVAGVWSPAGGEPISPEQIRALKYTEQVAREIVRFRPPATMVPHIAAVDYPLTEWYTIPKGSIVFPSVYESSFQGFTEPDRFDPDRFGPERFEDRVYKRNYLAFGAGPHQCVGQRYAINHLVLFIALFVSLVDFKRCRSDGCDEIAYVPTIVPKDDCCVYLEKRVDTFPRF